MASTTRVTYSVDDAMIADFEIDTSGGFVPAAGKGEVIASVRDAVGPAMEAAKVVLRSAQALTSEPVTLRFGVKVNGDKSWSVARSVSEGNFEVTLSWRP